MDLATLVTACSLSLDPKLVQALVWHNSRGSPWTIGHLNEPLPRVFSSSIAALADARRTPPDQALRIGLSGVTVRAGAVNANILEPCANLSSATSEIARLSRECASDPAVQSDAIGCAIARFRGTKIRPDIRFAEAVMLSLAKGDVPNFDMPEDAKPSDGSQDEHGPRAEVDVQRTSPERPSNDRPTVGSTAEDLSHDDRPIGWASGIFPSRSPAPMPSPIGPETAPYHPIAGGPVDTSDAHPPAAKPSGGQLFVPLSGR